MELTQLKRIGLTDGEIKVYDALLKLGECTKTALAKRSGIAPSNIYDITNRLLEKGIISKVEKNGVAHFAPASPRRLVDFVEQKKAELSKEEQLVKSLLPSLLARMQRSDDVRVEVFQGWNGMKTVFEDLLHECRKGDRNYVFGASRGMSEKQADMFFLKHSRARAGKGIVTQIIFNEDMRRRRERISYFLRSRQYHVRFLDQTTPTEIMVYRDTTAIIILNEEPLVIRITGAETAASFKEFFNSMWRQAKR